MTRSPLCLRVATAITLLALLSLAHMKCVRQARLLSSLNGKGYKIIIARTGASSLQQGTVSLEIPGRLDYVSTHVPLVAWLYGTPTRACSKTFDILGDTASTDDDIESLRQLALLNADVLWMGGTIADDSVASIVSGCNRTHAVFMSCTLISSRGFGMLLSTPNLCELSVVRTSIDGNISMPTRPTKNLLSLYLNETGVTDQAVIDILNLFNVQTIDLTDTMIRGECCEQLCIESTLASLAIGGRFLASSCFERLKDSTSIHALNVRGVSVDDECLRSIASFKSLEFLAVDGVQQVWGATAGMDATLDVLASSKSLQKVILFFNGKHQVFTRVVPGEFRLK